MTILKTITEKIEKLTKDIFIKHQENRIKNNEQDHLLNLLIHTKNEIKNVEALLNNITDEDIIESGIFKLKSLKAYENFLYKQHKEVYLDTVPTIKPTIQSRISHAFQEGTV